MTSRNHERGLTASQKRTLLWMPAVGLWLVLFLVSKNPEGGRDWSSLLLLGAFGTVAYVIVWAGLMRLTDAKKRAAEKETAPKSRAEAIYGPKHADEADDSGASDE